MERTSLKEKVARDSAYHAESWLPILGELTFQTVLLPLTRNTRGKTSLPRRPIVFHGLLPVLEPFVLGDRRRRRLRDCAHRLTYWSVLEIGEALLICCLGAVIHLVQCRAPLPSPVGHSSERRSHDAQHCTDDDRTRGTRRRLRLALDLRQLPGAGSASARREPEERFWTDVDGWTCRITRRERRLHRVDPLALAQMGCVNLRRNG